MKVVLLICNVQWNSTNSNCTSKAVGRLQVISGYCVLPIRVKLSLVVWAGDSIFFCRDPTSNIGLDRVCFWWLIWAKHRLISIAIRLHSFSDVNPLLFACVEVLHQNQKVKSEIFSFKEQIVTLGKPHTGSGSWDRESARNAMNIEVCKISYSRMRSEGFSFNSGGLEVGVVFAECCFGVRNHSQPFATVRFEVAKPHRWAALTKCDKIICWRSISSQIAWFHCVL